MKAVFKLAHKEARSRACQAVWDAPDGHIVTISPERRSVDQNAKLWAMLADISEQLPWYGKLRSKETWKNLFVASLKKLDLVPNLDNDGFVMDHQGSSSLNKKEFSDLIELIAAFGVEHDVEFKDYLDYENVQETEMS